MLRSIVLANLTILTAGVALGQGGDGPPAFEVASIRISQGGGQGHLPDNIHATPGSLTMRNVNLKTCIRWAYHVMGYQVSGPDWITGVRYDISAKASGPATEDELRPMLQALLAERFKLALHRQTKEMQAYVLLTAKNGPKFHESHTEGEGSIEPDQKRMIVTVKAMPLTQAVEMLSDVLRTPVVDQTGLKGRYDATLDAGKLMADMPANGAPPDPVAMITAVLDREFGLKLELKKTALEMLIVDHAEKAPVEN